MKRYLLLLLGIMIAAFAMAADVITKKNGTTIQCKVTEVGSTVVKYKRATNLNGPDYTLDLSEISSIKYENGSVDNFGESSVIATNAGQRTMTDAELMKMYWNMKNSPNSLKKAGIIVGGVGVAFLATGLIINMIELDNGIDDYRTFETPTPYYVIGGITTVIGAGIYVYCKKKAERYSYSPLFEQDFQLGNNSMLTADVNMINDNITHDKSLGLGLRFTF